MNNKTLSYYTNQSPYSDPRVNLSAYEKLPVIIAELCVLVHGLIVHYDEYQKLYYKTVNEKRKKEPNTRYIETMLQLIKKMNPQPLSVRPVEQRFLGSCRDFSLLLCSFLRYQNIPARIRGGFARYFHTNWLSDHWICEYWNKEEERWNWVDPELGKEEIDYYNISFTPFDVPSDKFIPAGKAWLLCEKGKLDSNRCGVKEIDVKGLWFIKATMLRDLAALNKIELLPWDYNKYSDNQFYNYSDLTQDERRLLTEIATLTSEPDKNFDEIIKLYQSQKILQFNSVISYSNSGKELVAL